MRGSEHMVHEAQNPAPDLGELRDQLSALLGSIERGDLPAEVDQVAYLRGALAAVEVMAVNP
jgi:hypothetical protein